MKTFKLSSTALLLSLFLVSIAPLAYASYDPTVFNVFIFNVTIDGSPAAIGTNISSYVNGVTYGNATPSQLLTNTGNGTIVVYGDNGTDPQAGARDADTITFKVNGVAANSTPTPLAFSSGAAPRYITLAASSPAANATLVSPANNSNFSTMDVNFTFKFESQTYSTMNCLLGIDSTVRNNNSSVINNTNTVLNSTTSPGRHFWNVTCSNTTETVSSAIRNFTVDTAGPNITSAAATDPDIFYSAWSGNEVAHLRVSATDQYSDISFISANFSNVLTNVSLAIFNLTYNSSSGYWEYSYNLSTNISWYRTNGTLNASSPVLAHTFVLTPVDSLGNQPFGQPSYIEVLLHDLGAFQGPPAGMRACFQEGSEAEGQTNFTKVLNFNAVNLVTVGRMNGSQECNYNRTGLNESMPWNETFKTLGKFNFSSVNISTLQQASMVMSAMGDAIRMQIAPPHSFQPSRIYVNTTRLAALNTTTSVTLYDLPFSSQPNITYDDGAANVNITWTQGGFNSTYNSLVGNLTFSVASFSGYNVSDELQPTINVTSPAEQYSSSSMVWINYSVNGTGTEISFVRLEIKNATSGASIFNFTYNASNETDNSAQCSNVSPGSEVRNCYRSLGLGTGGYNLANGTYLFNITAWDFGAPPAGDRDSTQQQFTLENVTPSIALVSPANNSNLTNGNITFQFNVTDSPPTVMCTFQEDGGSTSSTFSASANGSTTSWNVSHPQDGSHTWAVNCTDAVGLSNTSETRFFLVDTTAPSVVPNSPVAYYNTTVENVTFNWTATDDLRSAIRCNLTVDGALNVSNILMSNGSWYNTTVYNFTQGVHNWSVSCRDDLSNTNSTMTTRVFTVDSAPPAMVSNSPANQTNSTSTTKVFNFTATDSVASALSCTLYLNGVANSTNASTLNNTATLFTLSGMANGPYTWLVNCSDGTNTNATPARTLLVDNLAPAVVPNSPVPFYNTTLANVTFNWTATDTYRTAISCNLFIDGVVNTSNIVVANGTWYNLTATANFSQGEHSWQAACLDDLLNTNTSMAPSLFTVDYTPPAMVSNSPANETNSTATTQVFNFTASDNIATTLSCGLYINGALNATNSSVGNNNATVFILSGMGNGPYSWYVNCSDGANANSTPTRTLLVDNAAPSVVPNSPVSLYNTTLANVTFNWTTTDAYRSVLRCNLTVDGAVNRSDILMSNGTWYNTTATANFSEGVHTWSVSCRDDLGNTNSSMATRTFTIDLTGPSIIPTSPSALANTSNRNVTFNWTASDALSTALYCNFSIDGSVNRTDILMANGSWYNTTATTNFSDGGHNWSVTCWDGLNNTNSTMSAIQFTVDATPPTIALNSPANLTNTTNSSPVLNWTASDALRTIIACNLTIDGSVNRAGLSVTNGTAYGIAPASALADGTHNWSATCWDDLNNSATSATRIITVDTTAPLISILTPLDNSVTTNNTSSINFTATDAVIGLETCQYKLNNGSRVNITACANVSEINLTSGVNTLVVFANDTLGNERNATVAIMLDSTGTNVMLNSTTSVSSNNTQVTVVQSSPAATITMSSTSTNVTLNVSALYNSSTYAATLPSQLNVTANTTLGTLQVEIPANTVVSGALDWSGTLTLPYIRSSASFAPTPATGYTATVTGVVEIGLPATQLNFSNPVKITIPGKAGAYAGFTREGAGSVTQITATCNSANDSASIAAQLVGTVRECKIDSGSDLVIWTTHFTQFISYTQALTPAVNPAGSGGSGTSAGGNVGAGGSYSSSSQYASDYTLNLAGKSCAIHISRSIDSSTSVSKLTTTLVNSGGEGCTLSEFVFSDTVPRTFANASDISFSMQYSSKDNQTVAFGFPTFAPGESKTIAYSVSRWAKTSSVSDFTVYSMSAKQPAPVVPAAPQPNATAPAKNETPAPGSDRDSHGCIPSAGYTWCEAKGRCLRAWVEPCVAPEAEKNETQAPSQPEPQKQDNTLLIAALGAVVMVALGIAAFKLLRKHRKGLGG